MNKKEVRSMEEGRRTYKVEKRRYCRSLGDGQERFPRRPSQGRLSPGTKAIPRPYASLNCAH